MHGSLWITVATGMNFASQVLSFYGDTVYKHVAVFSVDGLHSSDVEKYVNLRPKSSIASLLATGFEYTGMTACCFFHAPVLLIFR